jgi:hypothetical protein
MATRSNTFSIGFWIILQFFNEYLSIIDQKAQSANVGIAYLAHIGGFFSGLVLLFFSSLMSRAGSSIYLKTTLMPAFEDVEQRCPPHQWAATRSGCSWRGRLQLPQSKCPR